MKKRHIGIVCFAIISVLLLSQIAIAANPSLVSYKVVIGYDVKVKSQSLGTYNFHAGLFELKISDGKIYYGYCIDINRRLGTGSVNLYPAPDTKEFRTMAYITTWFDPWSDPSGMEAASIQGAIWRVRFSPPYGIISPSSIVTRLNQIYNEANSKDVVRLGDTLTATATPASPDYTITATLTPARTGVKIIFSTTEVGGTFDKNFAFTDSNGQAIVKYFGKNPSKVTAYSWGRWPTLVDMVDRRKQDLIAIGDLVVVEGIPPMQLYRIYGYKFNDTNANGNLDNGENKLQGWTIQLLDETGMNVLQTTQTDEYGRYEFMDLTEGNYIVKEELPNGWINTTPIQVPVELSVDNSEEEVNFGNFKLGVKGGYKFEDINGNGVKDDGEPFLNDWTITLYKWDGGWVKQGEAKTGDDAYGWNDGYYEFTGLTYGLYRVEEEDQTGWTHTTSSYYEFTVISGFKDKDNNFGNFDLFKISGYKYEDTDGTKPTDSPLEGWTIILYKDGTPYASTTTDEYGYYEFTDLGPGTYTVSEDITLWPGWVQTYPSAPGTHTFDAISGQDVENLNFWNFKPGVKSGYKWEDINGNGIWDKPGEPALDGWTIKLFKWVGGVWVEQGVATTGDGDWPDGYYEFTGLTYGLYRVEEVVQTGWIRTHPDDGYYEFTVESGFYDVDNNFGNFKDGVKGGYKFEDHKGDGPTIDDTPLNDWIIELYKWDGGWVKQGEAKTGDDAYGWEDGYYEFTDLGPGKYKVQEVLEDGWTQTYPVSPSYYEFTVISGFHEVDNNFYNSELGKICGYKFYDANADREWDKGEGEDGLEGWTIELWLNGVKIAETKTGPDGKYCFEGLKPGEYTVKEISPSGWTNTTPTELNVTLESGEISEDNNFGNVKIVKKTFELTLQYCHPWKNLDYYGAVRLLPDGEWQSVELVRVGDSLLWKGTIDNLKPGQYEWKIYTFYDKMEIILTSGEELINEDKVNEFTFGKTSLEVWKTVDKVEKLDGGYKVTGKIYIKNTGSYNAYILSIEDFVQQWKDGAWVKFADGVIIGFSPVVVVPPGVTVVFDYYVNIPSPTLFALGYGSQGAFTNYYCCYPTHDWRNVVRVKLFNSAAGIHVYTYTKEFSLPK